jgi:hypothetical protein
MKNSFFLHFHNDRGMEEQPDKFTWNLSDVVWCVQGEPDLTSIQAQQQRLNLSKIIGKR